MISNEILDQLSTLIGSNVMLRDDTTEVPVLPALVDEIKRLRAALASVEAERDALCDRLASRCVECGERNPAPVHTCTPWETRLAAVDAEREAAYQVAQQNEATARKLNAIIAALREPSEAVVEVVARVFYGTFHDGYRVLTDCPDDIREWWLDVARDAIAAAEREVEPDAGGLLDKTVHKDVGVSRVARTPNRAAVAAAEREVANDNA